MPSRLVTVAATGVAVARATNVGTATAATRSFSVLSASNATPIVVGATAHNLQHYLDLARRARDCIRAGAFPAGPW